MTKQEQLLTIAAGYVAEEGRCSIRCIRIYTENRISRPSWNEAIRRGMTAYNAKPKDQS